ncbi:winged helix-turn-helix domain-containing protein (plasmid) [Haloarcula marismortui]|uniref:winged helix-turn-helix domain-containing protein n=1 Tax=Haloarcula marismortui TaxID=2238 RepID=UPI003C723CD3
MPIHHESHPEDVDLKPGTTKSEIVVFLYQDLDYAYTPSEIAEELDIPKGTATTTLRRLHKCGYVGRMKEGYYHGLNNREDLRRYPQSVAETEALFTTHPDNVDTPEPDLTREADEDATDDGALEAELDELEDEFDV